MVNESLVNISCYVTSCFVASNIDHIHRNIPTLNVKIMYSFIKIKYYNHLTENYVISQKLTLLFYTQLKFVLPVYMNFIFLHIYQS